MNLIEKAKAAWDFNFLFPTDRSSGRDDFGQGSQVVTIATNIIDLILFIAGVAAIIYLIYSGILYITAAGNPDAAKKGQQGIINAVIGIVIIVLAWVIARAVASYASGLASQ